MKYAKLIDGEILFAPNPIIIGDRQIGNPPYDEDGRNPTYEAGGYKKVVYSDKPETEPGYIAVPGWEETEDEIVQTWSIEEAPISDEDALVRYANELTGSEDETLIEATETLIKLKMEE